MWTAKSQPATRLRLFGWFAIVGGTIAIGTLIGHELLTWYDNARPNDRQYIVQRILFALATLTDAPIVQIMLAGLGCVIWAGFKRPTESVISSSHSEESTVSHQGQ